MTSPCRVCGGSGVIRCADVYRNLAHGTVVVAWDLSRVVRCGCQWVTL
jgi:hypothetical protein